MHDQEEAVVSVLADAVCERGTAPKSESEDQAPAAQKPPHRDTSKIFSHIKDFVVQRVCDLKSAPASWLWPGRIPLGHLTLLAGDCGTGKSLLALDLAARVSRGAAWPDAPHEPQKAGNVLVLTAHDDPALIGRPRLERAGANLERVFFATGMPRKAEFGSALKRQIRLPDDLLPLAKIIFEQGPIPLVVLDPAWVFCNPGRGRSRLAGPAQLAELAELAAQLQVALVCVTDLRRDSRGGGAFRAGGDRALTAAAQTGWGIVRHPKEHDKRLLLPLKMNLGPQPAAGLEFRIKEGRIEWDQGPATLTAEAVIAAERWGTDLLGSEKWLQAFLANGKQPAKEIIELGRECGYSEKTLRRAKAALGVRSEKGQFDGASIWFWLLQSDTSDANETVAIFENDGHLRANSRESLEDGQLTDWPSSTGENDRLR